MFGNGMEMDDRLA